MGEAFSSLVRYHTLHIQTWTTLELLMVAFSCTLLAWYLQYLWRRRKLYKYSSEVPGPLSLPFIGSALHFIGSPYDIFCKIMKLFREYPGLFRIWYGYKMIYAISDPKYYEILLPNCLKKDNWYEFVDPIVGKGLFAAPYDTWKRHRRIIQPTFNQKVLNGFVEVFSEQSEILVEEMKKVAGKGDIDICGLVYNCTLDIICETAMGVKVNTQTKGDTPMYKWIDGMLEIAFLRCFVIWYHVDTIFNMTSMSKDFYYFIRKIHEFCGEIVREKKKLFDETRKRSIDSTQPLCEEGGLGRKAFLDYLLEVTSEGDSTFTEEELKEEVITFIIAGSDTTASTNSFAFVMLGLHKDLQEKVYEEIMEVVGPTRPVECEDLPKLKYMDMFIRETLRLFPVAAFLLRAIDHDVDLGDRVVPAGVSVIFGILRTHTNEEYWPDPYRFDPDRFLPEEVAKRHPCAYVPFSYGPRNCIGLRYAMMAMKSLLATVLRKFKVSTPYKSVQDIKLKANLMVRPKDGYKVSLELR